MVLEIDGLTAKNQEARNMADRLVQEKHTLLQAIEETQAVLDQLEKEKNNDQELFQTERTVMTVRLPHFDVPHFTSPTKLLRFMQEKLLELEGNILSLEDELQTSKQQISLMTQNSEIMQQQVLS